jgi:MoaA/NifB/PqqE/SkfB family radical SAM enzyme
MTYQAFRRLSNSVTAQWAGPATRNLLFRLLRSVISGTALARPVGVRHYLAIAVEGRPGESGQSWCAKELLDAAGTLVGEWIGSRPRLLGVDQKSARLWDFTEGEPIAVESFDPSSIHVILNLGFLLLDAPPLAQLIDDARRHGVAWSGAKSSRDLFAVAFSASAPGFKAAARKGSDRSSSLWNALVLLTACLQDDAGDDWKAVAGKAFVPLGHSAENSPAMAGVDSTWRRRWVDSPCYWNTALKELFASPARQAFIGGDPLRMAEALAMQRETSRVRFVFNALLNEIEHRTGERKPRSYPVEIHLSMTGQCNIECRFCGYTHQVARSKFVETAQIEELDFLRNVNTLRLNSGLGEPTLNKDLARIITHVADHYPHIGINFFTNAIQLGRDGLIEAIVGKVRWINISLNAATREGWKEQCKVDQFERVCANIRKLSESKRFTRSLWPVLHASMVLNRANVEQLPLMPALCRSLGIDRLTAFPYFALGFGADKFGPDMTLASFRGEYDALYDETVKQAERHQVSIEIPSPSERRTTAFGLEIRPLYDFAGIEVNERPLGRLLSGLKFEKPPGAYCHFLWRQGAIGSTNNAGHAQDATHYMYPCLGPLSSVDLSRRTAFRFGREDFMELWRNPVFEHLRSAQHTGGVCKVCDHCRGCDTRDPAEFAELERSVAEFSRQYSGTPVATIDVSAITRRKAG